MIASRWYAVHTNARAEWLAHSSLQYAGFETFYPHVARTVSHGRKRIGVLRPYFPRYLFVAAKQGQAIGEIATTRGVSALVCTSAGPLKVPGEVVAVIRERCDGNGKIIKPLEQAKLSRFVPGDRVRIEDGPFIGLLAEVAKVDDSPVVRVWIEAFGRVVEAVVPERDLGEPLGSPDRRSVVVT